MQRQRHVLMVPASSSVGALSPCSAADRHLTLLLLWLPTCQQVHCWHTCEVIGVGG
jgi:hypothetical protein